MCFGLCKLSLVFFRREDQINVCKKKFIFLYVDSLMCQSVNLVWKMVVQNANCVFVYFGGGHNSNFQL